MNWWRKKKNYPDFYLTYLEKIKDEGFSQDILSLDLETTGLDTSSDQILSYGSVPVVDNKIVVNEEVHRFFSVHKDIENSYIHEIVKMEGLKSFEDFIPELLNIIGNKKILGHFIQLDLSFINHQLTKMKLPRLKNPIIDTLELALAKNKINHLQYASKEDYTLYNLCAQKGIAINTTHVAIEDAYLTALLYLHLLK
jgi:DNA polymerase-3 subunit epsilon